MERNIAIEPVLRPLKARDSGSSCPEKENTQTEDMKRILLTTLLTFFAAAASAQRGGVTATVVDADTGESIAGAVLTLSPVKTPEKKQYFTSAFKGAVSIPSLAYGEY